MSEWTPTTLGAVLADKGYIRGPFGSALKRNEMAASGIPVYEQKNAIYDSREFRFFIGDEKFQELKRFQVKTNDLIISCSGTVGQISIINESDPKGIISQALLILRPNTSKVILRYLYYFLSSRQGYDLITQASHGSVQVNIAERKVVENIPILLPLIPEQIAIAAVLGSLDDKIDLLHRQNRTLEAMAETLFRQWFVEEAKEDWTEGTLGDVVTVKYGKAHQKLADGAIPAYGSGGIMRYVDTPLCSTESVLIPRKGSLGNIIYINEPFWTVDTMFFTEMRMPNVAKYVYFVVKSMDLASMNVGSAVPSMTTEVLNNLLIAIPSDDALILFEETVSPMFKKVKSNMRQIKTLENLRDNLLPKLMSGEVSVDVKLEPKGE